MYIHYIFKQHPNNRIITALNVRVLQKLRQKLGSVGSTDPSMVESINGQTGSGPIRETAVPDPDLKLRIWPFVDPNPDPFGELDARAVRSSCPALTFSQSRLPKFPEPSEKIDFLWAGRVSRVHIKILRGKELEEVYYFL
jgi:hypothetical protein